MAMNMKSSSSSCLYVFFLLIFLLLVDKSHTHSANLPPSLRKFISKAKDLNSKSKSNLEKIEKIKEKIEKFEKYVDAAKEITETVLPPPPPRNAVNAPPSVIKKKGLNVIKRYLSEFGYLDSSAPYNDTVDADTKTAIKSYQQFFNLYNKEAVQHMFRPRCWVPDVNFDAGSNLPSWPKAGNRWFPKNKTILSYFLGSEIPRNATDVFRNAFARWAEATTVLKLTETRNSDDADIIVNFYIFNSSLIWDAVVGGAIIKLKSSGSNVKIGELVLDANWDWVPPAENGSKLSWEDGVLDLETVVMHQIGHLLGFDHSNKTDSVMYPVILPQWQRKVQLSDDDKNAILKYYTTPAATATATATDSNNITNSGHQGGPFKLFGPSWGVLTTLSLGFASMVLL